MPKRPLMSVVTKVSGQLRHFWHREDGQDLVEYSLLLAFIALTAIGLLSGVKTNIKGIWTTINNALESASTTAS
jgi:Flp pilus assembly pilin Flp